MDLVLPKPYLSYSQMRIWLDDKDAYRSRYYHKVQEDSSIYMTFGKNFAEGLENKTISLPNLPQYEISEYQCNVDVDGIPFFAFIDTYSPKRFKFREYKTGVIRLDGKPRWTEKDVKNHMQLDIYSLLIQIKDGYVDDECHLDWIETQYKMKCITDFAGNEVCAKTKELELSGKVVSFPRIITQTERDRMRVLIRTVAHEISVDYANFLKTQI